MDCGNPNCWSYIQVLPKQTKEINFTKFNIMDRTAELMPNFRRMNRTEITGSRTRHVLTFNPNSAKPGEEIYVNIPKLKADSVLVPDSIALVFDSKNSNTKSWFRNNLGKLLQKRLEIRLAGEKVYDNSGKSLLEVYKDLWLHKKQRDDIVEDGIATEATRKKISKDDAANDDADATALFGVFGTKQRIKVNKIFKDHGLYAPHNMANDLQYVITLPAADEIMSAQGGESVEGYTLENIELEYKSIDNNDLARKAEGPYGSERELSFEHTTLMKKSEWDKNSTIINETINIPRRSMKAIVMLFTNKTKSDSEEYVCIPQHRKGQDKKFALVIDLRTANDANTYGNGAKIQNTQSGILVEITKKAITAHVVCYMFVLSDGVIRIANGQLAGVKY
ncbi:Hypothetical predicted protein [Paramuricea clavata]|uniref:Uncharacterized protein n=1 Tax=Paramuricea clavata TaxID=317549 RepID=A0A6S7HQX1_PARCT|nr:Hypothetical predicted protein [Paramuricea clavata]